MGQYATARRAVLDMWPVKLICEHLNTASRMMVGTAAQLPVRVRSFRAPGSRAVESHYEHGHPLVPVDAAPPRDPCSGWAP